MVHATPGGQLGGEPAGTTFTAAVSAITDAFGDPTRRRIYLFVRDHASGDGDKGVTAATIAAEVGIHPNVARHHLDKLAAGGYVEVRPRTGPEPGRKAGRPSKRYVAARTEMPDEVPVHTEDLVLALLGQALARLPQAEAEAMAEEVGATYGRTLAAGLTGDDVTSGHRPDPTSGHRPDPRGAGQRSLRTAMQSVAAALTAHGFAARTSETSGPRRVEGLRIISEHCPFGNVAIEHPVLCAVDRGMVRGMLAVLYPSSDRLDVVTAASKAHGDTLCATAV
jgi:predicted ArsR family transcriptional regulator